MTGKKISPHSHGPVWALNLKAAFAVMRGYSVWVRRSIDESGARRANGRIHLPTARAWLAANFEMLNAEYEAEKPKK